MPRWLRRAVARSELHSAWLSGFHGRFEERGVKYGPARPYPQFPPVDEEMDEWSELLADDPPPPMTRLPK